jgi:hypothetical protein
MCLCVVIPWWLREGNYCQQRERAREAIGREKRECEKRGEGESVCVRECVRVRESMCERECVRERESVCVRECVCVRARERECVSEREYV